MSAASRAAPLAVLAALALALFHPDARGEAAGARPDASGPAYRLLDRVSRAVRELSYRGTFVYHHDGRMEAMRIVHRGGPDGQRERLYSLTGAGREIIRDDQLVTCILPDDGSVMVDRRQTRNPISGVLPADGFDVESVYSVRIGARGRVAGRMAQQLWIEPRDQFRYGLSLWIDEESALLLRSELLDEADRPVEQIMFTDVEIVEKVPDQWLEPTLPAGNYRWFRQPANGPRWVANQPAAPAWDIERIPQGFVPRHFERAPIAAHEGIVERQMLTDGFATISVYVNPLRGTPPLRGHYSLGAVNAHGTVVDGHQVVAVGAVPAATVAMVADSVRYHR